MMLMTNGTPLPDGRWSLKSRLRNRDDYFISTVDMGLDSRTIGVLGYAYETLLPGERSEKHETKMEAESFHNLTATLAMTICAEIGTPPDIFFADVWPSYEDRVIEYALDHARNPGRDRSHEDTGMPIDSMSAYFAAAANDNREV